ncbi:MAG: hypothetical protein PHY92_05370 [Alphaproteobacteria bacterium]|nr:hypothetical protein [Alphaproteobacteria bacterium]
MPVAAKFQRQLFSPPYALLPPVVFLALVLCFIFHPASPLRTFDLIDPDNYMRLNQVVHWLSGHGWYDLGQPRLSPGDNTVIYWSRLVDLPIAALAWPLSHFMSLRNAALAASLIIPPAYLGLLLIPLLPAMVRPLVPRHRANLTAVMLLFAPGIVFQFMPGRVDHHGLQLIIAAFGFLCLTRLIICPRRWRFSVMAAIAFACGLWIGAEAFPGLILFACVLFIVAGWKGGLVLRNAALFGAALALATAVVLLLARRPEEWGKLEITWFSSAYVIFSALLGAVIVAGWGLGRFTSNRGLRLSLLAALGFFAAALFFLFVPQALQGPYADLHANNAPLILDSIGEAQPLSPSFMLNKFYLFRLGRVVDLFFKVLFVPLMGLAVVTLNLFATTGRRRVLWAVAGSLLLAMILTTLFWQVRAYRFMQLFTILPVTWLVWLSWDWIKVRWSGRPRFWAEIVAFCMLGFIPVVLLPAGLEGKPLVPDVAMFPLALARRSCDFAPVSVELRSPESYGARARVVMNTMNDGAWLLFLTPHQALSAPYNVAGNRDSFDFFNARREDQALNVLRRRKADLVLLCRDISPLYAGVNANTRFHAALSLDREGKLHVRSDRDHPTMIERLIHDSPPPWLKRVEVPADKDYLLYEVRLPEGKKDN